MQILPDEIALVDQALRRRPRASNYRLSTHANQIVVYERTTVDMHAMLGAFGLGEAGLTGAENTSGFAPVLRFALTDPQNRCFRTERRRRESDAWEEVAGGGPLAECVRTGLALLE